MVLAFMEFAVAGQNAGEGPHYFLVQYPYFMNLLKDILRFFNTGELSFPASETLETMRLRDAIIKGKSRLGEWLDI